MSITQVKQYYPMLVLGWVTALIFEILIKFSLVVPMEIGFIIIIGLCSCMKSTLHAYYENTCVDYEQFSIWLS